MGRSFVYDAKMHKLRPLHVYCSHLNQKMTVEFCSICNRIHRIYQIECVFKKSIEKKMACLTLESVSLGNFPIFEKTGGASVKKQLWIKVSAAFLALCMMAATLPVNAAAASTAVIVPPASSVSEKDTAATETDSSELTDCCVPVLQATMLLS